MQYFLRFERQPEGKAVFKSKFSHKLGEVEEKSESMTVYTRISSTDK